MRFSLSIFLAFSLCSCASTSTITPDGPDTFQVSREAPSAFSKTHTLKLDAIEDAKNYCDNDGKRLQIVRSRESEGPYLLGKYPRADVTFRCLDTKETERNK